MSLNEELGLLLLLEIELKEQAVKLQEEQELLIEEERQLHDKLLD